MGSKASTQVANDNPSNGRSWFGKKQRPPPLELPKAPPSPTGWPQIVDSPANNTPMTSNSTLSTPELIPSGLGSETPHTPGPSTPLGGHLGFDFTAIKELLANEESKFETDTAFPPTHLTLPSTRQWLGEESEGAFPKKASTLLTTLPSVHYTV
jgi:hypothetical protein